MRNAITTGKLRWPVVELILLMPYTNSLKPYMEIHFHITPRLCYISSNSNAFILAEDFSINSLSPYAYKPGEHTSRA